MSGEKGKRYYEEVSGDPQTMERFLESWGNGILQGLCEVSTEAVRKVVRQCAAHCVTEWLNHLEANHGWERTSKDLNHFVEKFNEHVKDAGPESHVDIEDENTVLVEFWPEGKCVCPLIANNILEGTKAHCQCSNQWIEIIFERVTGRRTTSDLLAGILMGDKCCAFRAHLQPENYR
jgi:hypothetical protein